MGAGCEPHVTIVLVLLSVWQLHLRQRASHSDFYGIDSPLPLYMYTLPVLVVLAFSYAQANSLRAAFLSQKQIVRIRELRIEQLAAEKERLEFERAQLAFDGASGGRPNLPDAGSRSRGGRSRGTTGSTKTDETPAGCIRPYLLGRARRKAPRSKAGSKASDPSSQAASGTSSWPAQTALENGGGCRPVCYPLVAAPEGGRDGPTIVSSTQITAQPVARYPSPATWPSSRAFGDLRQELSSVEAERDIWRCEALTSRAIESELTLHRPRRVRTPGKRPLRPIASAPAAPPRAEILKLIATPGDSWLPAESARPAGVDSEMTSAV